MTTLWLCGLRAPWDRLRSISDVSRRILERMVSAAPEREPGGNSLSLPDIQENVAAPDLSSVDQQCLQRSSHLQCDGASTRPSLETTLSRRRSAFIVGTAVCRRSGGGRQWAAWLIWGLAGRVWLPLRAALAGARGRLRCFARDRSPAGSGRSTRAESPLPPRRTTPYHGSVLPPMSNVVGEQQQ